MLYDDLDGLMAIDDKIAGLYSQRQNLETRYLNINERILDLDLLMNDQKQFIEYRPKGLATFREKYALKKNSSEHEQLIHEKGTILIEFNKVNQNLESRLEAAHDYKLGLRHRVQEALSQLKERQTNKKATSFSDRVEKAQATEKVASYSAEAKENSKTMK